MQLNEKIVRMSFKKEKLAGNGQMDLRFMILKNIGPLVSVCLYPGAIYMYNTEIFKDILV